MTSEGMATGQGKKMGSTEPRWILLPVPWLNLRNRKSRILKREPKINSKANNPTKYIPIMNAKYSQIQELAMNDSFEESVGIFSILFGI